MRIVLKVALAAALVGVGACGSSGSGPEDMCKQQCERGKAMNCSSELGSFFDYDICIAGCAASVAMDKDTTACVPQGDAYRQCVVGLSDVCAVYVYSDNIGASGFKVTEACPTEGDAYALCIRNFCLINTTKTYCR